MLVLMPRYRCVHSKATLKPERKPNMHVRIHLLCMKGIPVHVPAASSACIATALSYKSPQSSPCELYVCPDHVKFNRLAQLSIPTICLQAGRQAKVAPQWCYF